MASILGPHNPVPACDPVVIQCLVERNVYVVPNHPCFITNTELQRVTKRAGGTAASCRDDYFVVTCDFDPTSKFVGVVASLGTNHGDHSHISVYIRGSVTMACDLSNIATHLPLTPLYLSLRPSDAQFVGIGSRITPPDITTSTSVKGPEIGHLIEKGRMPTHEVRIMLTHTIG